MRVTSWGQRGGFLRGALAVCGAAILGACASDKEVLLVVRDDANRALEHIEVRDVTSGAFLGETDASGAVRLTWPAGRRETLRIRLETKTDPSPFTFEDPIAVTEADARQGSRLVRAQRVEEEPAAAGRAVLAVETEPPGATVVLNDQAIGATAVVVRDLEPGRVQVQLRLAGYETHAVDLLLLEGENRYTWELRRKDGTEVPATFAPPPQADVPRPPPRMSNPDPEATGATGPESPRAAAAADDPGSNGSPAAIEAEPEPVTPRVTPPRGTTQDEVALARTAIQGLLDRYVAALERRDVAAYAALFVELSADNRTKLRTAFEDLSAQDVELRDLSLDVRGAEATARFLEVRAMSFRAGRDQRLERDLAATFRRGADGEWRFVQVRSAR